MNKVTLNLTVDEVNAILQALSNMPYAQVYQLVHSIQSEAAPQLEAMKNDAPQEEKSTAAAE